MSEFYTTETVVAIWEQELTAQLAQDLMDSYDPYSDFDDVDPDEDFPINYEYDDYENEEHIDYYAEASLFGEW